MKPELRALYHEVILDHGKHPRNFKMPEGVTHSLAGFNPLCGDRLTLYLRVNAEGVIQDAGFLGNGCAISVASASLMTESIKGKTVHDSEVLFNLFHQMVTGLSLPPENAKQKWHVLAGVCEFPARVKCATLAWHTLLGALHGDRIAVSTEGDKL